MAGSISKSAADEFVASYAALRASALPLETQTGTPVYIGASMCVVAGTLVWRSTEPGDSLWVTVEDKRGRYRSELRSDVFLTEEAARANLTAKGWMG